MFGISLIELIVIFAIILIFLGPDKLPEASRKLGKVLGELKRNSDSIRREFYNSIYAPANEIRNQVRRELTTAKNVIAAPVVDDHEQKSPKNETKSATKDD